MFRFMRGTGLVVVAAVVLMASTMLPAAAAPVTITAGSGDLPITQVVLDDNGSIVTQNASQGTVVDADDDRVDFVSITVDDGGTSVSLDNFNVGSISTTNYNFPPGLTGVTAHENAAATDVNTAGFEAAVDRVLNSMDLRDYLAYDGLNQSGTGWNPDFDMVFTAPLRNSDYLLVSERFGNTFFDLVALDKTGTPIAGGNVVGFDAPYRWNSGYAPADQAAQPMWFSVIDIEAFGVDTEDFPIYGFRIDNDGEADVKFFGLSADPFEPGMTMDKTVYAGHDAGVSCSGSELVTVATGADVTFCFTVTNTGEAVLDDLTITDADLGLAAATPSDLTVVSGSLPLAPGDTIVLAHDATASGTVTNTATASADVLLSGGGVNTVLSPETATDTARVEVIAPASISGSVVDQDGGPIAGVTITLSGAATATTTTGTDGTYSFTGLAPGIYTITETQPAGYSDGPDSLGSTGGTLGNDVISDINLPGGVDSVDNDFSENVIVDPASISGTVVDDLGRPIAGVTISLGGAASATTLTADDGTYSFPGLAPGSYTVTESQPVGYGDGADRAGSAGGTVTNDVVAAIVLVAGQNSIGNDFAETTAGVSGSVVDDAGRGIAGVTVRLTGTDATGAPVARSTTTDSSGNYAFTGLLAGTYTVTETQPTGYDDGADTAGSTGGTVTNDVIAQIVLGAGVQSVDNDFSEVLQVVVDDDLANTGSETPLVIAFGLLFIVSGAIVTLVGSQLTSRRL